MRNKGEIKNTKHGRRKDDKNRKRKKRKKE